VGVVDQDAPPAPIFAVNTLGDGTFRLGGISFSTLENTQTISTGTWTLLYFDEVSQATPHSLAAAITDTDTLLSLDSAGGASSGDFIQMGTEVLEVVGTQNAGLDYEVGRRSCGTAAQGHAAGAAVLHLSRRTESVSFKRSFFGSVENATWAHHAVLPNARLACSTLLLTNSVGDSPLGEAVFTGLTGGGLRSLRGGQFTLQIEGVFGVLDNATPVLSVQENLSIRDVYALVKAAPLGSDVQLAIRQDGALLTTLTIPAGQTQSPPVDGATLPSLQEESHLTLDIVAVGSQYPGGDLTVTIRV
jgi:hypothetical protein